MRNDSTILQGLGNLFDTLKGDDQSNNKIAVSTFMALLFHLNFDQTEPEYFTYVWKRLKNKQSLKKTEFLELLDKPKKFDTDDPEEMKNVSPISC